MLLSQTKNRGYWKVQGVEYDNKVRAVLAAQELGLGVTDISFHYNDTWWDSADWSKEPTESLEELYVSRARQLREKYDTVIVRFSGGADSVNVLRTFVDNNIKVDIVAVNVWNDGDPDHTIVPNNIEKVKTGYPILQELQQQGADFKIITSDQSPLFSLVDQDPDWFLNIDAPRFTLIDVVAHRSCTLPEYQQWNSPSTCIVSGVDKPQVWCHHDKIWFFKICDFLHTMHNQSNQMVQEPFYWSADMPEIPIKQSHCVKKYYQTKLDSMYSDNDTYTKSVVGKNRLVPVIYPKYFGNVDPLGSLPYYDMADDVAEYKKKNNLGKFSPRGMGTDFTMHLSPHYQGWLRGVERANSMIHREFKNMDTIMQGGLIPIYTKTRWLGK